MQVARELDDPEALVATIIPDGGRPYVSKVFNDSWMREHGYLGDEGGLTVGEVIRARGVDRPLLTVGSHDPVGRALELMREHGVSQVPVVSGEDGRAFMGTVSERGLLMASADHPGILGEPVTEVIEPPLPELAAESPVSEAIHMMLGERKPVIVVDDGRALGILVSVDLIEALNRVSRADRHPGRPRRARARPDLRLGDPADPPDLDLRPAGAGRVRRATTTTRARPTPPGRRSSGRSASSRAARRPRSPAAWPRPTRC